MMSGEFLTRITIWISIAAYAVGCCVFALGNDRWTRLAWTIGCAALLAHLAVAFQFFHGWSHAHAYVETARQTEDVFGINWGGGIYINYAVAALWTLDVAAWWFAGLSSYRHRPWLIVLIWHSFLIFIMLNATVVFKNGVVRWVGLLVCLSLILNWIIISRQRTRTVNNSF